MSRRNKGQRPVRNPRYTKQRTAKWGRKLERDELRRVVRGEQS